MALTTDITLEERDALYEQALDHLSRLGDLWSAIDNEDFETAERLGREVRDELRLIEDLGWGAPPGATTIKLTMPNEELHRVFTRLRCDAEDARGDEEPHEAEAEDDAREFRSRAKQVTDVCERVLSVVGRIPPPTSLGSEVG